MQVNTEETKEINIKIIKYIVSFFGFLLFHLKKRSLFEKIKKIKLLLLKETENNSKPTENIIKLNEKHIKDYKLLSGKVILSNFLFPNSVFYLFPSSPTTKSMIKPYSNTFQTINYKKFKDCHSEKKGRLSNLLFNVFYTQNIDFISPIQTNTGLYLNYLLDSYCLNENDSICLLERKVNSRFECEVACQGNFLYLLDYLSISYETFSKWESFFNLFLVFSLVRDGVLFIFSYKNKENQLKTDEDRSRRRNVDDRSSVCSLCKLNQKTILFLCCGHFLFCFNCFERSKEKCPICKSRTYDYICYYS